MSRTRPITAGRPRPVNTVVQLREAYLRLNGLVFDRLADRGHGAVRTAHGAVFQYLDEHGTTVSALAERAGMTKQAMAELVQHLERHGYLTRIPDPTDRRAKLVQPTPTGNEVIEIAQQLVPEIEQKIDELLGVRRAGQLRRDLAVLQDAASAP
jgi:DNA-binding MarR family transcriptional regulator